MIRVGLVGCGNWGRNYIRNFEHLDDVEMYACCDAEKDNLRRAARIYHEIKTCTQADDLINDSAIDALVLATPPNTHFELARRALESGKHVLVEKPLALTAEESRSLITLAKEKGKILMVGHILEYNPATLKLKQLIDAGDLGRVNYLYLIRTNLGRFRDDVNVLWDLAPHDISILLFLLGKMPKRVSARGKSYVLSGLEDITFLLLEFDDNVLASLHVSWLDPVKIRRVTVIGDQKMAVFDDLEPAEKIRVYDRGISYNPSTEREFDDFASFQLSYRYGDITIPQLELSEPLRAQCTHFIDCIKSGANPRSDGESGWRVVKVLEAAQKSLANDGIFVDLDGDSGG